MNIVLIGMRGSGKTSIAKLLAEKLNHEYIEMDELIVKKAGMTIPEIVEKHGWDYFRDLESAVAKEISAVDNKIVSSGGGVVVRTENIIHLKQNGIVILLTAHIDTLLERIGDDPNRPSLTGKSSRKEEVEEIWEKRKTMYSMATDTTIDTTKLNLEEVTQIILEYLKGKNENK